MAAEARSGEMTLSRVVGKVCSGGTCGRAGLCFVAGTLVATPQGAVPIEQLKLGDRVEAGNPQCADEHLAADTVTIGLEMPNPQQPRDVIRVGAGTPAHVARGARPARRHGVA